MFSRSGNYNTDLAKAFNCPIIHVNGDHPELAYKAGQFAVKYRNKFAKDIVIDLVCFRKYGHNELDDPSFTNPLMYKKISGRKSVPDLYEEKLVNEEKVVEKSEIKAEAVRFRSVLDESLNKVLNNTYKLEDRNTFLRKQWANMSVASFTERTTWDTGCDMGLLKYVGVKSVSYPKDFVSLN
jgi:probable 2-oxoglutarate dehydrogenase E1 component DHKTD1